MKAADLRKSILQAALQGKLVPQDKNDEPASELLKRIQAEKAALIKAGKLKKEKPLSPITEDEIPYDLPDEWVWCRLSDISTSIGGKENEIKSTEILRKGTFPVVSQGKNYIDGYSNAVDRACKIESPVIMFGDHTKNVKYIDFNFIIGADGTKFLMPFVIDSKFFYYLILNATNQMIDRGYARHFILLKQCVFQLPPFAEQQRIVAKVDELMTLCDELEAAEKEQDVLEKHLSEDLPKAILQSAVQGKLVPQDKNDEPASELLKRIQAEKTALIKSGKLKKEKPLPPITEDEIPYDLPEGWVWCRLGQLCQYGVTKNAAPSDIPDGAWVLELEDVEKDTGRVLIKRTTPQYEPQSTKHIFKKSDILYSKLRPYLNKVLIADTDGYCTSEILPLHFSEEINTDYLLFYFRSPLFVEYANSCSYGVKMPRLGTNDGQIALLPLPPFAEQQRIVGKVDELMTLCDELKRVDMQPIGYSKVVPFPSITKVTAGPVTMAARGDANNLSAQAKQAIEDLFAEDE